MSEANGNNERSEGVVMNDIEMEDLDRQGIIHYIDKTITDIIFNHPHSFMDIPDNYSFTVDAHYLRQRFQKAKQRIELLYGVVTDPEEVA